MLVSIAMCTYNGERFLKEQIDSILNQSFKNIELIVTDDCSSDTTVEILEKFQKNDIRIKIYQNEKNLGFLKNFEKSISLCTGDYIALADQDDIWKLNKIELFLKEIGENTLIYSDALLIDQYSKALNQYLITPGVLAHGKCNKSFLIYNSASGNTMMFKKKLVDYILPIPKEMSYHDIWIAFIASTIGSICVTKEAMTYYRRYDEQVTRTIKSEYKSSRDKINQRENGAKEFAISTLRNCRAFSKIKFLDEEAKLVIDLLIEHYSNFEHGFFNLKLFFNLLKYRDEIFGVKPKRKRIRYARKNAMKLNLRKLFLYKI